MLYKIFFWAFPAYAGRRATGYASLRCWRTMLAHALRMPNACAHCVCMRTCVRDSSEKPAMSVANEDLQRIARPERSEGHALICSLFYVTSSINLNILQNNDVQP